MRALVLGLAVTNEAVVRQVQGRGGTVVVLDDRPSDASRRRALDLGVELQATADVDVDVLVRAVDVVLPSPGVPIDHAVIAAATAAGVPVWSEFELAAEWDDRPIVAVTGTNGKTTVTELITMMLTEAGRTVIAAGNNDLPLVDALDRADVELFVVEASSFRLQFTERFRAGVGVWLNLSPDHLDWHPSVDHYAEAKFRLWANQRNDDVALANADDPVVVEWSRHAPSRVVTFGLGESADYRIAEGALRRPGGAVIAEIDRLPRRLPHDLSNAIAAAAAALEAGAGVDAVRAVLERFEGLPHRVQLVGDAGGVRWYDDSKATTPASVVAGVSGFPSAVLIAGGRNKGLDLAVLRDLAPRLRAVIAIGEAGPLVARAFEGAVAVRTATSMDEAVAAAGDLAEPGDAVVLSPGCASYDWYRNYGERGDDFARAVRERIGASA
ncbi:MAG TPA: UDP-N-acetylmuramoyl-L-alanine--D-glutamate ligase [Acidimicrobiales bacterium]|nr:UDP-N-acetylmuramoyl-L-alanine--D-glutamate ligase [Acidimicrobiales bacterium]